MEQQENLDKLKKEIGTKEAETLKEATVKVMEVKIEKVGEKGNEKVVCSVKHPDREEPIEISSVKYENPRTSKLEVAGLWYNTDDEDLIRKGSVLAIFMGKQGVKILGELRDKEIETIHDDRGFLCFKAY